MTSLEPLAKKKGNLITVEYPSNQNSEGKIKAVRARGKWGGGRGGLSFNIMANYSICRINSISGPQYSMLSTVQIKLILLETSERLCILTKILGYDCQNISDLFVALNSNYS